MTHRSLLWIPLVLLFLFLSPVPGAFAEEATPTYQMIYEGEFIDQAKQPITGIFPLSFKLYSDRTSSKALWSERRFVSVVNGRYRVFLGSERPLPTSAVGKKLFLGVSLGNKEMFRQPLSLAVSGKSVSQGITPEASYCGRCTLSDDATSLGGLKAADYAKASDLKALEKQVEELKKNGGAGGGGGATVGNKTQVKGAAGGRGGTPYTFKCPPGQVVVGIQGAAGAVVDSVSVLCAPLE